jgi:hypothetical protein
MIRRIPMAAEDFGCYVWDPGESDRLSEAGMQRLFVALTVATAAALGAPTYLLAAGAYMPKPPVPVQASMLRVPSLPSVSLEESFRGCGGKRVRDPKTHQCRGPGDIGR